MATPPDLPRVTSVLSAVGLAPDLSGIDPAVLERARERGSRLHELIEAEHYGYLSDMEIEPAVQPYFDAFRLFRTATSFKPIVCEVEVQSERWGYVGHADCVGWYGSTRTILDWKATATLDKQYVSYQLAAYRLAWREMHPKEPAENCVAVQFRPDATFRLHKVVDPMAEQVFLAALIVYRARAERGGA